MTTIALRNRFLVGGLLTVSMALAGAQGQAPAVPHSLAASPDIYKVIAENDKYRVIEVTWQPGQRDKLHSHPDSAVYYTMECSLRGYRADGTAVGQFTHPAGKAVVQAPIAAHSVENIGANACKLIMFEPK